MLRSLVCGLAAALSLSPSFVNAQSASSTLSVYQGYTRTSAGSDPTAAVYDTADSPANVSTTNPPPDVFLNASVHVTEIDLTVSNITAKINLDAQVLSLLKFNAGVNANIDRVRLLIQDVNAKVTLEARLANLVLMIGDILDSIDLNPVIATLGQDVGTILNDTGSLLGSSSSSSGSSSSNSTQKRDQTNLGDFMLERNILYSVNDYSGNTHTNRILAQNGDLYDEKLDNQGDVSGTKVVGTYLTEMSFNGFNETVTNKGTATRELQYEYKPFIGLNVICAIFQDADGNVVKTRVLAEAYGGGSATIDDNLPQHMKKKRDG